MKCVHDGGEMFTVNIGKDKYRHGCRLKGKTYYGEIKTKKKPNSGDGGHMMN